MLVGRGVRALSVQQVLDPLVDRRLRNAITDAGEDGLRRDQLSGLSELLNDIAEPSLGTAVGGFFDAADGLARNPAGLAERQALLGAARGLAAELNRRADGLAALQRSANDRALGLVTEANDELDRIEEGQDVPVGWLASKVTNTISAFSIFVRGVPYGSRHRALGQARGFPFFSLPSRSPKRTSAISVLTDK